MRVLADSSVWIQHFRRPIAALSDLLVRDQLLMHPNVQIELALGSPPAPRRQTLALFAQLAAAPVATSTELLHMIEVDDLSERGCGMVGISLLAAVRLHPSAKLWTMDKALASLAQRFGLAFDPSQHLH